jgi:hypothetical protein
MKRIRIVYPRSENAKAADRARQRVRNAAKTAVKLAEEGARIAAALAALNPLDVAWAAGFWEGEGSVSHSSFTACQKSRWPLERLVEMFGGSISYKPQDGCHSWWLSGERGRLFARAIRPYLSPRRIAQIEKTLLPRTKIMTSHQKIVVSDIPAAVFPVQ